MKIFIGEIVTMIDVIYSCLVLLNGRNTVKKSWWNKPMMQETIHVLITMGCYIFGPIIIIEGFVSLHSMGAIGVHAIVFLAFLFATVIIVKKMNIKQHLAEYDAMARQGGGLR